MRRLLATLLALGAAAALAGAQGALWVQRDLLDSGRFAGAARNSLQSEEVRRLVGDAVAERVLAQSPVAVGDEVRGRVASEVAAAATSDAFADAFEVAVEQVHGALVDGRARRFAVDLSAAAPAVREAVARVEPRLAEGVAGDSLGAVDVGVGEELPDLSQVKDSTDAALRICLLLAGIALTLALLVAPSRPRVVVVTGIGVAAWSTLLALASTVFVDQFAERLDDPALADAARAVVREMTDGLRLRAAAAAALGLVAAALAWFKGRARPALVV